MYVVIVFVHVSDVRSIFCTCFIYLLLYSKSAEARSVGLPALQPVLR